MTPAGADRRRDKRLELTLPVKFSTRVPDGSLPFDGVTHNVSSGGVYFEAPGGQMAPAASVWVRIGVPARQDQEEPNLTLVAEGTVSRVEPLAPGRIVGPWPEVQKAQGICGIALQFEQRPTIQLQSLEDLLWEDREK